ncbi:MAG TPA: DUF2065 domain-containing protein, partial [Gammaproteobacteria bacterium]|nr:DUF2065 domain-containing protein [Gammaproteobacteria bacterium]
QWRRAMFTLFQFNDHMLRLMGLISMTLGIILLYYVRP